MADIYDPKKIEKKWQETWEKEGIYKTQYNSNKPKQYILDMFPYPSGEGLHVGHPRGYIATDVYGRMKRMQGFNVLHPMGWDAFGLPAENFAIKHKIHPRVAVEKNIKRFKEQLSIIGFDYDWSREIYTTDPAFYKWTQWIFLQMYEKGLAYQSFEPINWCPSCQTGLANEDVESDGTCERCDTKVEKRPMRQWVLKITDYADRMLADLDALPKWPEGVKEAQRNWIGRTEGAEIEFEVAQKAHKIKVFTTRPETIFGATFIAVSAGLASSWIKDKWTPKADVKEYIESTLKESAVRDFKEKEKTGIFAGFNVVNPATKEEIPVWITNYVLDGVGTGAIMAVPAHDERDFDFAKKFGLPITQVIAPETGERHDGEEIRPSVVVVVENSKNGKVLKIKWGKDFGDKRLFIGGGIESGEDFETAARREVLEEVGYKNLKLKEISGKVFHHYYSAAKDKYRMTEATGVFFELLDEEKDEPSLNEHEEGKFSFEWVTKEESKRDTVDELHKFLHEYFLENKIYTGNGRLINSDKFNNLNSQDARQKIIEFVEGKKKTNYKIKDWVFSRQRYWGEPIPIIHCEKCGIVPVPEKDLPVVLPEVESYQPIGTGESPLADISDWVNVKCPNCGSGAKRETNTMPQWAGSSWYYLRYVDPKNDNALIDSLQEKEWIPVDVYVGADHATRHLIYARFWHKFLYDIGIVSGQEPFPRLEFLGYIMAPDGRKMSKRWGNVINPDDMVARFGADAFRLYISFIGPFEGTVPWNTDGMVGTSRFLEKVWRIKNYVQPEYGIVGILEKDFHKTIKKVTEDISAFKFNTAVSSLMILVNTIDKTGSLGQNQWKDLLKILAPFSPHMAEELWQELGEKESIHLSIWPAYDESLIKDEKIKIMIQINGKIRDEILIDNGTDEDEVKKLALAQPKVIEKLAGTEPKNIIYVEGRLVNIVI